MSPLNDTELQRICALLLSPQPATHRQGLELLQTLVPAGPGARRGLLLGDCAPGESLAGCDLAGARFVSSKCRHQLLCVQDLRAAGLVGADMRGPQLSGMDLSGADLRFSIFPSEAISPGLLRKNCFKGACLRGADLSPLRESFVGLDFHASALAGADMRSTIFRGTIFRGGRFSGIDFTGADFTGADLCGANFKGASLAGADLTGAALYRVNFKGVDLRGATLDFDETIRWDAHTRWPIGVGPEPGQRPSRIRRVIPRYF